MYYPLIIQGGMGAGVSGWRLANAVSKLGQLGVVSGTALDLILVRRLQMGDPGAVVREAIQHFPFIEMGKRIIEKYFIPGGKSADAPFKNIQKYSQKISDELHELAIVGNFVEVFLAKKGHSGKIGINYLEKIQFPLLPSLYGAMLAGVDYILIGAGIPLKIPAVIDALTQHKPVSLKLNVENAPPDANFNLSFNPEKFINEALPELKRPDFFPIVSSFVLAKYLLARSNGRIDGFILENHTAGGHNAPPRGQFNFTSAGEPIYGKKDEIEVEKIKKLGLPFWIAGSYATPLKLNEAVESGAKGIQVGTAFAFSKESGLEEAIKRKLLENAQLNTPRVFTDPLASPTGFPFKVLDFDESLSNKEVYDKRPRVCDLGYLSHPYVKDGGALGFRCPAEPIDDYLAKGGKKEETCGRKCLCNALMANIGLAQTFKNGYTEKTLVTAGDDFVNISRFIKNGAIDYSVKDVIDYLMNKD